MTPKDTMDLPDETLSQEWEWEANGDGTFFRDGAVHSISELSRDLDWWLADHASRLPEGAKVCVSVEIQGGR